MSDVADIVVGKLDAAGSEIETVYSKVVPTYAVYRTAERIVIQYADDDKLGADQRLALAPLNVLKGEINGLIDGWRSSVVPADNSLARLFDRRVADAVTIALQGDQANPLTLLQTIKADVLAERTSRARSQYLGVAAVVSVGTFLVASILCSGFVPIYANYHALWQAAGFGALGALFSIAISIRDRSILTDLQNRDNTVDAVLRIFIGATAAAILVCLIDIKLVTVSLGGGSSALPPSDPSVLWAFEIVIAFIAGFSERWVSDLLQRTANLLAANSNPIAGNAGAPAAARKDAAVADEKNPLGRLPAGQPVAADDAVG